ncbi:ABC transporter ATP-binding protein [Treponema primitia]|uniref:ABC transporter ATP-binding protein n=1 Tax=Treponema primitia TaxID=88058 RepID=UPI00025552E5|nr:ATP-binding cassette domain-containing protein [Treponema primitia]
MLSVQGAYKTFEAGTPNENAVLRGLNLELSAGEFVTIIGSNGAGKSTLFNVIGGNIPLDGGSIILDGEDITNKKEFKRARDIGRLFQDPHTGTAPDFTIEENLALVYSKVSRRFALSRALRAKDRSYFADVVSRLDMGLESRLKTPASLLSGGQRQALTLLLATLVPPKLLLLDEHTAALDPVSAKKVIDLTAEITKTHNITTLMITHSISQALELGTRTVMMHKGKIVMDISGDERHTLSAQGLLERYKEAVHEELDTDRILLET